LHDDIYSERAMADSIFKLVYFIELVLISLIRSRSTAKYRRLKVEEDRAPRQQPLLLALNSLGVILPLFYLFTPWLDFANYHLPDWTGWLGAALFAGASLLLWKSHRDLGPNWTPAPGLRPEHRLVKEGVFSIIRHPMYAAHLLWAIAQPLLLRNWMAGFSLLVPLLPQYLLSVDEEEKMLLERFGEEYRQYLKRTGRLFPRLF
jgi:protein-S-isoprenylcysteine O-methyltransferase Ste14